MIITIPFKTPTINHLYYHIRNMKVLKKEAKELREKIHEICKKEQHNLKPNDLLKVKVDIYEEWFTRNGEVKKRDIANREKFLIDSVFKGLGIDDKNIFRHELNKINSKEEKAIITIETL